jgi:tRNA(Ile2) C34 agmatinyltransferase TiaS
MNNAKGGLMTYKDMLKLVDDICPACGNDLDTGYECNGCGKDYIEISEEIEKLRLAISKSMTAVNGT